MNSANHKQCLFSVMPLLAAAMIVHAQSKSPAACTILDKSHRAQFISYERASNSDVYFRLHNNTSCPIVVETDDRASLRTGAGRFVALHYLVHDRRRQTSKSAYGWGDSVFKVEMFGGDSVTFSVPLRYLKKRLDVAVPFVYAWENDNVSAGSVGGVNHSVYFLSDDIPANVLRR